MLHGTKAFLDNETFLGDAEIDAATGLFASEAEIIALGIIAEEREVKAIFAPGTAVAGTGVASGFHEYGHHIQLKANSRLNGGI